MTFKKITESDSNYDNLEKKSSISLLKIINKEDQSVANNVKKAIPEINKLVKNVVKQLNKKGRLFYIGSGTSGRLGVVDASECPPTFGVDYNLVIGIIAGGDKAIKKSIENAEDDFHQGWKDLKKYDINKNDFVIGIAASGTTPYVLGAIEKCNSQKIPTGCITCNPGSPLSELSKFPVVVNVGPEVVTGSSRMKAGTAQKMVLNMISTTSMIMIGKVEGNKMIDMQLTNYKLSKRATKIVMNKLGVDEAKAKDLLKTYKSVRLAISNNDK
ncbi:MAG: N-acetylmuramic acid 6-phosphate etherase [Flavobacteriaceae bacterium]|nr:MAG: N-acetylmuramic acid 6-phosphate etherase [Cryomorphaceae bacterium]